MPSSVERRACRCSVTSSAHSASSSRRHSWCRHAVHASTSDVHALGVQHADDLRDHAAHRRADDVRALDALGVEHLDRVLRPSGRGRTGPGGASECTGAAVVERDAAVAAAERAALERPARGVHARGPGSAAPACRRAGPRRRTRSYAVAGDDLAARAQARSGRAPRSRLSGCARSWPTASRTASAKRARRERVVGVVGLGRASPADRSAPATAGSRCRTGRRASPRPGSIGACVIACISGSGGVPGTGAQPRRRERDRDEVTGAQARAQVAARSR